MLMLSRYSVSTLCSCLILVTGISMAQASNDMTVASLGLATAVSRTINHNPELTMLDYQLDMQRADTDQASLGASPELNFRIEDVAGSGLYQGADNAEVTLGIAWVMQGDITDGRVDVSRAATQSLNAQKDVKRLDLASDTARLFTVCLANQARLVLAQESLALTEDTVAVLEKQVGAGRSMTAELTRAQADAAQRKLVREDIEHELASAYRLLAAQWGDTEPNFGRVSGDIFTLPEAISYDNFAAKLERSPAIAALVADRDVRQAELKLQQAQSSSPWKLDLGVRHYEFSDDQALVAGIAIPFGKRSQNQYGIARARAALSQIDSQEQALRVRNQTSLYVLYQEFQHSLHRSEMLRNSVIPLLEKALKETRRAYSIGRYSYLEWQSVQNELLEARLELLEASIDAHLKIIEIERLSGVSVAAFNTGS